jgi:hypothetical protein
MREIFRNLAPVFASLLLTASTVQAADKLGIPGEEEVTTQGKVVDVSCELTRDCPAQCGAGKHQLGVKTPEGKILLAAKNAVNFMGSTRDLLAFCGKDIWVDGVTTNNFGTKLLMVQRYKASEKAEWRDANQSIIEWAKANHVKPDSEQAENWMRNDRLVKAAVAKKGRAGVPE